MVRATPLLLVPVLLLTASGAAAQIPEHGPLLLRLSPSTSAVALGGAFPVARAESGSVFVHPGVLDRARGVGLGLQRWGDGATLLDASGARDWWSGGVSVGVRALSHGSDAGTGLATPAEDALFEAEGPGVSELVGAVGYGRELGEVRVGSVGKWIEQRIGASRSATAAADVGLALSVSELVVGLAVQNLGPALEREDGELELPRRVRLDASFTDLRIGPLDLGAAATALRRADGEIVPAGGLELTWWPVQGRTFVGRIGARRVPEGAGLPLSFGGAFYGDDIGLEYAYGSFGAAGATHRIGLRWR